MKICEKQIKDLKMPHDILFAAIIRGDKVILPGGTHKTEVGDRLLIFATKSSYKKLESLLSIKLEML